MREYMFKWDDQHQSTPVSQVPTDILHKMLSHIAAGNPVDLEQKAPDVCAIVDQIMLELQIRAMGLR